MNCPSCTHENRPGAKFCEECAAPLKRACESCGSELRPAAKFCDECATPVPGRAPAVHQAAPPPAEPTRATPDSARKIVTIVFADLVGSTALHERLDPESARRFMESYYAATREAVEQHGGKVTQLLGDGVKAVFGIPRVAEDDALRAVRAAVAMQEAFRALAEQQRGAVGATGLRVAVNTGEVVAKGETEIIGDPVNVAARLQEQGRDGDVVIGESTHRLVSTQMTLELLGSFALKGRAEQVKAYRVVSLDAPADATTAAFVGRDDELARITAVFDKAVATPAACLAVLVGSPGLGKSRLIDEFARRTSETATVVSAHCDAAGGATFAPLADAISKLLGIEAGASAEAVRTPIEAAVSGDDAERKRITDGIAALLAGSPAAPEETFFVIRRLLAGLAATRPVVLVIDDLQWAEPLLLDLVEHLVQWGGGVQLLVLVGARPELRDVRSSLVMQGGLVADVMTLTGLDAGAAMRLAANVIGADDLPAAVAAKVLATSEGNPLFVGELVRMLVDEGALTREGDRWTIGTALATLEMPPTIHALLAARIERLKPEERSVLERAAVIGRHFSRSAVAELLSGDSTELDARLESLQRGELIERDTGWLLGEPMLRFHHVLIRDAAYRRILKGTRAELHARFADWVENRAGDAAEYDETIGRHLEQAHQLQSELGPLDAAGRVLGERASKHLAAAGRRALARDDVPLAASLLGRALDRLDPDDRARADLALDWCEALLAAGDVGPAVAAIDELGRFIEDSDRLRAWHTCFAGQHAVLTAPEALDATAEAVAAAATALAELDDAAGEAKAHFVYALALSRLGKVGACEAALDQALAAARRAGDRRRANTVLAIAPLAALWGPSPVTRASGRCLDVVRVLRITQGAPAVEAVALSCQGVLEALRGRTDAARRMIASARKMVEELGITQRLLETDVFAGLVALLEGDAAAAERSLRGAYDGLRELGLGINAAQAAALLARALLAQDRAAEAEALSHASEELAGDDLKAAIAWRGVRAEALARRGEHAAAVEFAMKAVEIAASTDALLDHADARLALAAALRAAGRSGEAAAEERRASELWETKGATLLGEQAARELASVAPAAATTEPRATPTLPSTPTTQRRVRPNAATATLAPAARAWSARDLDAYRALFSDGFEEIYHPTGSSYGVDETFAGVQDLLDSRHPSTSADPLATLGPSLMLTRRRSGAHGMAQGDYDVGEFDIEQIQLLEVDEGSLLRRRSEVFATEHLGDAIARLYERYSELLPAGPARERAAATACSIATWLTGTDMELGPALAPEVEVVDRRTVGFGTLRGAQELLDAIGALVELSENNTMLVEDVLALRANVLVSRSTHSGTLRDGGGTFERPLCSLVVFGADGRITRYEQWDAEHEAEALARFDALVAGGEASRSTSPRKPAHPVPQDRKRTALRRVRPNDATAAQARQEAALATRDFDAVRASFCDDFHEIDHSTGSTWGADGPVASLQRLYRSRDPSYHIEVLATLGSSLLLGRRRSSASGATSKHYDVGEYENEVIMCLEVDERGRFQRAESFSTDRLGDAVARFYERYAERLPPGQERDRAAAAGRCIAALGRVDPDRTPTAFASGIVAVDHRTVGFGTLRGSQAAQDAIRALLDLSDQLTARTDDVLALGADAFLCKATTTGTLRDGGGAFERNVCILVTFGADGLITRFEQFDGDREADALARFDELAVGAMALAPHRRVRANRATAVCDRFAAALDARDAAALDVALAEDLVFVHHATGTTFGKPEIMKSWGGVLQAEQLENRIEPYATLGESLALVRQRLSITGIKDDEDLASFGPAEAEIFVIAEEAGARLQRIEQFPADLLGNAVAKLYERYAEQLPAGPARVQATGAARTTEAGMGPANALNKFATMYAPTLEAIDHRTAGVGAVHGAEAWLDATRALFDLTKDVSLRADDVLAVRPNASLIKVSTSGVLRDSGGTFERAFWCLTVFDDAGLIVHMEQFNPDSEAEALARFDVLTGGAEPPQPHFANAAQRRLQQLTDGWEARDWHSVEQTLAPAFRFADNRRLNQLDLDREHFVEQLRILFDQPGSRFDAAMLATRGEQLMLARVTYRAHVEHGGPLEIPYLLLWEYDAEGRSIGGASFDLENESAAYTDLDARYDAGEGAQSGHNWPGIQSFARSVESKNWDAIAALCAESFVEYDHRSLATLGTTHGGAAWAGNFRALADVTGDAAYRVNHFLHTARGYCTHGGWHGTRDGGSYEIPLHAVIELDPHGRWVRADIYDDDGVDAALARFGELSAGASPPEPFANAATRLLDEIVASLGARDWTNFTERLDANYHFSDRRRFSQVELDRDGYVSITRAVGDMASVKLDRKPLATRGERLVLFWARVEVAEGDVGPSAIEHLNVFETNEQGDALVTGIRFDSDDLDAAYAELDSRYEAGEGGPHGFFDRGELLSAIASEDWEKLRTLIAPDIVSHDFRRLALLGTVHGIEAYVQSIRGFTDLAPDLSVRREHVRGSGRTFLWQGIVGGTREGGAFELHVVAVAELDEQGHVQRLAWYDVEQLDEAWARFDALTRDHAAATARPSRRVRANAATRNAERERAAVAARDLDTLTAVFADDLEVIYHPTGSSYGRAGVVETWREMFQARDLRYEQTVLGTLGETLALIRIFAAHGGSERSHVGSVGPIEAGMLHVVEVDAQERMTGSEVFADNRLSDAIACLYDRYAERLPEGPARECALATVRALRGTQQATEISYSSHVLADDIEMIDHRVLGTWNAHGADEVRRHMRSIEEVANDPVLRDDDVLALTPTALLVRRTHSGTERVGGGAYERPFVTLMVFGADGLVRQWEWFDVDHEAEALARFDEINSGENVQTPTAERFANAATRYWERASVLWASDDWDTLKTLVTADWRNVDRRGHMHVELDAEQWRTAYREAVAMTTGPMTSEVIATRGERLALSRVVWQGATGDIGPSEIAVLSLDEVEVDGRSARNVTFDPDDLDAAHAELDARWEAGEGGPLARIFHIYADAIASGDWDALRAVTAPDFISRDARSLAVLGTHRGVEAHTQAVRALAELAPDMTLRLEHSRRHERVFLWQAILRGTQAGSAFEFHVVGVDEHDEQGRTTHRTWYDVEQLEEAWARFDALTGTGRSPEIPTRPAAIHGTPQAPAPARRVRPNAATRCLDRQFTAIAARDLDEVRATMSDQLEVVWHPTGSTLGVDEQIASFRGLFKARDLRCEHTLLAALGSSLALARVHLSHAGTDIKDVASTGPVEYEHYALVEVDEHGCVIWSEAFAQNHLGNAIDRLYAHYAEQLPEGPGQKRAAAIVQTLDKQRVPHDRGAPTVAANIECVDHRILGTWGARGADEAEAHVRALRELADEIVFRDDDVLALEPGAALLRRTSTGTDRRSGGIYERPLIALMTFGDDGLIARYEFFDVDRDAEALARFDALTGGADQTPTPTRFANAATRALAQTTAAVAARDQQGFAALFPAGFRNIDRRAHMQIEADREQWLLGLRDVIDMAGSFPSQDVLATRGDRLALARILWRGAGGDIGPSEIEWLLIFEVDGNGAPHVIVTFDPDALDAAYAELDARWRTDRKTADDSETAQAFHRFTEALARRDWEAAAGYCAPGLRVSDHRLLGWGDTLNDVPTFLQTQQVLAELAPDVRYRLDHLRVSGRVALSQSAQVGTRDGGTFETPFLMVQVASPDAAGRLMHMDVYDPEQTDRAWARFEELAADTRDSTATHARFANAATRGVDRGTALIAARDWDGWAALFAADFRHSDRRRLMQLETGRDEWLTSLRQIVEMSSQRPTSEVLATRGERLALIHMVWRGAEGDIGPSEIEWLLVVENNASDQHATIITFDPDARDAAYAELDARWDAGKAAAYPSVDAWSRNFRTALADRAWDAVASGLASDCVAQDHRLVGWGTLHGKGFTRALQAMTELAPDAQGRTDHVRFASRGLLTETVWVGTRDGGAFESPFLFVCELDAHGLAQRLDFYDPHHLERALARFDEINAPTALDQHAASERPNTASSPERFANSATRAGEHMVAVLAARDADGFPPLLAPDFRNIDRRRHVQLEFDRDQILVMFREIVEMTTSPPAYDVLATRGEHLALTRMLWQGAGGDIGPTELEWLILAEANERGEFRLVVAFDPEALDAARAELDARWEAGEDGRHGPAPIWMRRLLETLVSRNWEAAEHWLSPTVVGHDHRLVGWDTLRGRAEFLRSLQAMSELAPDANIQTHHARASNRAMIVDSTWVGTRDGGAFESPYVSVVEFDAHGLAERLDFYDPHHLDRARARFEEIAAGTADADPRATLDRRAAIAKPNTVSAATTRWVAAYDAAVATEDWEPLRQLGVQEMTFDDRRRLALLSGDREMMIASARERAATGAKIELQLVGTAGDRVAIYRALWSGGPTGGRFEIEYFSVGEVDEAGLISAFVFIDLDDPLAALREAWTRWEAIDPTVTPALEAIRHATEAFNAHDRDRFRANYADDVVAEDHRHAGFGRIEGAEAYADSVAVLWELTPGTTAEAGWFWPTIAPEGGVTLLRRTGTVSDGGPFESEYLWLFLLEEGRIKHAEFYEPDALDTALARFAELRPDGPRETSGAVAQPAAVGSRAHGAPDPFAALAKPNAATRALDRWGEAFDAGVDTGDWHPMERLCAPGMVFEDRQRRALVSGDAALMTASARERAALGARPELSVVGIAGERVAIGKSLWAGGPADGRFEVEFFTVTEVDEANRITAMLLMDIDDPMAALREGWRRWAAIDPVAAPFVELFSTGDPGSRDLDVFRTVYADDLVVEDRRRTGIGRIEGLEAYHKAADVFWQLAPDTRVELGQYWPAYDRHAALLTLRRTGTIADGGGAFESYSLVLSVMGPDGRISHQELFEPEALDAALARFEELRPDPLRILPNAATRAHDRWYEAVRSGDLSAATAMHEASYTMDDRRRLVRHEHGREGEISNAQWLFEGGWRATRTLLATAGDRLALQRIVWTRGEAGASSVVESIELDEVDSEGRFVRIVVFDADDRPAASAELFERSTEEWPRWVGEFLRAMNEHDLVRVRAALCDDFVLDDHRRTGMGRLEGADAYIASVVAAYELSPDLQVDILYTAAEGEHGFVILARRAGTNTEGGAFESIYFVLALYRDEKLALYEFFEPEYLDKALARFEELRPDPLRVPPNAATQNRDRACEYGAAGDWDALRALYASTVHYEDRRPMLRSVGDKDSAVADLRYLFAEAKARVDRTLLATGGERIALEHWVWTAADPEQQFELDALALVEVDAADLVVAVILFHPDDRAAASAEMMQRSVAHGVDARPRGAAEHVAAWNDHDLDRLRTGLSDDYYFDDRRRTGIGLVDRDTYLASLTALYELSPDVRSEILYAMSETKHAALFVSRWYGTNAEGGEFESVFIVLVRVDGERLVGTEVFEIDDLDLARARFEELEATSRSIGSQPPNPSPVEIPPNAATHASKQFYRASVAREWDAVREIVTTDFVFEDRSKHALIEGDVESWIASAKFTRALPGIQIHGGLVGTIGERIALETLIWSGSPNGETYEFDRLRLLEVDAEGNVRAAILFDRDDRAAATVEALQRFAAGEAAGIGWEATMVRLYRAWLERDWRTQKSIAAPDLAFQDHRCLGLGTYTPGELIDSLRSLATLAPDVRLDVSRIVRWNRHGWVSRNCAVGTFPGGGPFEQPFLDVIMVDGERARRIELFEIEDLDRALARFEELCAERTD